MLPDKQNYLPVNWVDGMNINKDHFVNQDNYLTEQINDASGININKFNYGILPPGGSTPEYFKLWFDAEKGDSVIIKVDHCKAVTKGGVRIEITPGTVPDAKYLIEESSFVKDKSKEATFYIVISVNPFNRIPKGDADPNENPPRKPFTLPEYNVSLIPEKEVADGNIGLFQLVVGKVSIVGGEYKFHDDFIPPCRSMQSDQKLKEMHSKFEKQLSSLESSCIKIAQKVRKKQQRNTLAMAISNVSNSMLYYIGSEMTGFRYMIDELPPIFMLEKIASLARLAKTGIDTWQGIGKEEMLNYLTEWCDLNQGVLENILNGLINFDYNHNDIQKSLSKADTFLSVIVPVFDTLSGLDYIGKKTDTNLFVKEEMSFGEIEEETKRRK